MRVVWISSETPDRHGQGGQRRQYFQIRSLVEHGHQLRVVTVEGPQDDTSLRELAQVDRVPLGLMRGVPHPLARQRFWRAARPRSVDRVVVAHLESCVLLRERLAKLDADTLVDIHNVMSRRHLRSGDASAARHWLKVESRALQLADAVSVCSAIEEEALAKTGTQRRFVLPHGVDPSEWLPEPEQAVEPVVRMFGSWGWAPNAAGLRWFLDTVWPRVLREVPRARIQIAGAGVPAGVAAMRGVDVVGRVPHLAAFLAGTAVLAVPVRYGVGAPVKFAEALASGAPVIATTDAAAAAPEAPAYVSNDPDEWVERICADFADSAGALARGQDARRYAHAHLNWNAVSAPLHEWVSHG